ncbi:MAG: histidine kinase N-terminal domain-containing protein [Chloroflexota bacterium]
MDPRLQQCINLTDRDIDLLFQIEESLPLVADISRADILLCALLSTQKALVLQHVKPHSISSPYRNDITGRLFTQEDQPTLLHTLRSGSRGRYQKQLLSSGAPVIQDCFPIYNAIGKVIASMVVETNMIEHERHRRRDHNFRRVVYWLQLMATRGEIENPGVLRRFGPYDGIYLVGRERRLTYMNGIANNLFRSVGRLTDMRGQDVTNLEESDGLISDQAFDAHRCVQLRSETEDGRVWIRGAVPLNAPKRSWGWNRLKAGFEQLTGGDKHHPSSNSGQTTDGALILIHNATDAVQSQRQLNVKSAIIQEVHHRVKNNLQTIAAIMRMQARRCATEEATQLLGEAVNRILSMSVIHEFLSQDEHQPINIREVCQRIVNQVSQVVLQPEHAIRIQVTGPNIHLPAEQATATAMVLNELLLNAIEHGLAGQEDGEIEIRLEDMGNSVQMTILDSGIGLPDDFDAQDSQSLGLQIVNTLVTDDLKGSWHIERSAPEAQFKVQSDALQEMPEREHAVELTNGISSGAGVGAELDSIHTTGCDNKFNTQAVIQFPKRILSASSQ